MVIIEHEDLVVNVPDNRVDGVEHGEQAPTSWPPNMLALGHDLAHGGLEGDLPAGVVATKGIAPGLLGNVIMILIFMTNIIFTFADLSSLFTCIIMMIVLHIVIISCLIIISSCP